ncbi:type II toxin-antitoxin system VapC family toxin [Mycobacterium intracellulare]|uniref:type II toxin-antitoxin system VapC family toxin n=1 Tax=Mycobacterium intracellulare TaxID=1767 RepID=UPI0006CA79E2|nr:type II toxin-antitoxin system VapC family toxin [Mycobacterium intracellulare]KPN47695.1 hypothetical protein AN933_24060 [Mycobacterium intracellulare subsp. chimaera]
MIILDASVLIAHFEASDPHHAGAKHLLLKHRTHQFTCSTITLAEFYVAPARAGQGETARKALGDLEIRPHGIERDAGWRLAELRAQTGLKLPDCCVLYTAEQHTDCLVATFDSRLANQARKLGIPLAD